MTFGRFSLIIERLMTVLDFMGKSNSSKANRAIQKFKVECICSQDQSLNLCKIHGRHCGVQEKIVK